MVPDLSWLLLISGQDYPAQNLRRTESELADSDADAYIRWFPVHSNIQDNTHPWQAICHERYLRRIRVPGSLRMMYWPRRHPFDDTLGLYIGDTWVNLRAKAVDHILEQQGRLKQVERYLARRACPDEALLSTLLLNDSHQLKIVNDRKRFIRWVNGRPSPELLSLADLPALTASGAFFARKFDSKLTPGILDRLDEINYAQAAADQSCESRFPSSCADQAHS